MQVAGNSILVRTSRDIKTGIRSTSCNRGWLQIFTHIVCGAFTVTSFVMILVLTLNISKEPTVTDESQCSQLAGCRVICHEAPFYEEREDDIVLAVMAAERNCKNVFLTLHEPRFTNESLPQNWLSRLQSVVVELSVVGGNLHHIPQNAFSAAFARSLKLLHLEKITIASWTQHSLLGLANLENFSIKRSNIIDMSKNVLSAVSQTLATLTVVESGYWNPENLTGSSQLASFPILTSVDLSSNDFGSSLGRASFTRLSFCVSLYLGSNRISYIEPGAFDKLVKLEYLNLNDNLLTHIEPGLFNVMTSSSTSRARINLINNLWHCNCSDPILRQLSSLPVLLIDPTCNSPKDALGKTFYEFIAFCRKNKPKQVVAVNMRRGMFDKNETVIDNLKCVSTISSEITPQLFSPFYNYHCSGKVLNSLHSQLPLTLLEDTYNINDKFRVEPVITFIGENFTMIELNLSGTKGDGLIWYRNSCRNEIFCVNILPDTILLYNMDMYNDYTFCPVVLTSGTIDSNQCVGVASDQTRSSSHIINLILIPLIGVACLLFGALTLYIIIRKYPYLLKGSKRLLFVNHKTVDALVLPPKVPLRGVQSDVSLDHPKEILDITARLRHDFKRSFSMRSTHSIAPSYISALHPTEEQLADWRFKHANERFDDYYTTISTISSNTQVSLSSDSNRLYFSIENDSPIISISDSFSQNLENEPVSFS